MEIIFPNYNADIISGKSIGGLSIGDSAKDVVSRLNPECTLKSASFSNPSGKFIQYELDNGTISFTVGPDGKITALWCKRPYSGRFDKRLKPGMTASEIAKVTSHQMEFGGYLILDKNYKVFFSMPPDFDDFDDFDDFPADLIFEELHVGNLR